MLTRRIGAAIGFALALVLLAPLFAREASSGTGEAIVTLDPAQTRIEFTLAGSLHTTHGTFQLKSGAIRADPATGKAGGELIVEADSGESGNSMRDSKMKNEILESRRYPEIIFIPEMAKGHRTAQGDFEAELSGLLRLHGAEHRLVVIAQGHLAGDELTATGHFVVPYVEWGLRDPSFLLFRVADKVEVEVTARGHVTWITGSAMPERSP